MRQVRTIRLLFIFTVILLPFVLCAQRGPQDADYGARFFEQLRKIFGRFRDSDLRRVFDMAGPIRCSDLITDKGEWREVAFFNENRKLGDWYRTSLDEVKSDLSVYIFNGVCSSPRAPVQVITKFPIQESVDAYKDGRISFRQIQINENPRASVVFDSQTGAYTFE